MNDIVILGARAIHPPLLERLERDGAVRWSSGLDDETKNAIRIVVTNTPGGSR